MTPLREKRKYEKPAMQVIELQHRATILTTSGERSPYDPVTWP